MFRRSKAGFLILLVAYIGIACGPADRAEDAAGRVYFSEVEQIGLDFVHVAGNRGEYYFPEIMGSGGALFDFDKDGDLDVYLVQSGYLGADSPTSPGNRLFRNEIIPLGRLEFSDVTATAGVGDRGYGMGAAVADYDNDGWPDLYVTNFGANRLYRNNADGSFSDVTDSAGTGHQGWSTSATFFDYDADGDDDLFVANYVRFDVSGNVSCRSDAGAKQYCAPATYAAAPDLLLNNDSGRYRDVSVVAGISNAYGNGLGVIAADFNGDGLVDIYVANDQTPNILWINTGDGRFHDEALVAGAAYNASGAVEASMGVIAGDIDSDGDEDLFMTHLRGETNTLYINDGRGYFTDTTNRAGLGAGSLVYTGFGAGFLDVENDGDLDLFVANGAVTAEAELLHDPYPYGQRNQLFVQQTRGKFRETNVTQRAEVSRGALYGDLDNDGDTDIIVNNNNGPVRLLRNELGQSNGWLGVRLLKRDGKISRGRAAILHEGEPQQWRRAARDGSYLAANDPRVLLPLPDGLSQAVVVIIWPDGSAELFNTVSEGAWHDLRHGSGQPWQRDANNDLR